MSTDTRIYDPDFQASLTRDGQEFLFERAEKMNRRLIAQALRDILAAPFFLLKS